jgi:uncharacterized membrane protein (DUF485 family)
MRQRKIDWAELAKMPKFVELHRRKKAFMLTWWLFGSLIFYLLPICAGYFPDLLRLKVLGRLNVGYFFCLFEFAMVWAIAIHYTRTSNTVFDPLTENVVAELKKELGP